MAVHFRTINEQNNSENVKCVYSCCNGEVVPLERLSNYVYSSLYPGEGFGTIGDSGSINAPADGIIKDISANGKDITLKSDDGLLIIIKLSSKVLGDELQAQCLVNVNDHVTTDTPLWDTDISEYKAKNIDVGAIVVVTNSSESSSFNIRFGKIKNTKQPVMTIVM